MIPSPATTPRDYLLSTFLAIGSYSAGAEENILHLDDAQQEKLLGRATFDTKNGGTSIPIPTPIPPALLDTYICVALFRRIITKPL
jgi:hypothetical protein